MGAGYRLSDPAVRDYQRRGGARTTILMEWLLKGRCMGVNRCRSIKPAVVCKNTYIDSSSQGKISTYRYFSRSSALVSSLNITDYKDMQ
jgi:hypothetical protein